ncbi:hypothetical protein [Streptomyces sp. t39]|uniref:hypothetical protein n=1 Tax=Streptomyces sp. t39 TaxID=1828156 RepID=UPI0011CD8284|nr:hypothetical protein [Streptomyces sp. t39]TXS56691.1 hypothetical protein EAO77_11675 [Streptomyces sp. t39]
MSTGTRRTVRNTARRVAGAAAAAVLALGALTACQDEDTPDDGGGDGGRPAASASAPATEGADGTLAAEPSVPPSDTTPSSGKALTEDGLAKAALATGEVPGFAVTPLQGGEEPGTEKSDDPDCAPLAAVVNGAPEPAASATVYRTAVDTREEGEDTQTVVTLILTSHPDGGAEQVLSSLRSAVGACAKGFTARGGDGVSTYAEVKTIRGTRAGDDSIAYQVTGALGGDKIPLVFHVVRRGATVVTFYTANFVGGTTPTVPDELILKQTAKLP